MPARDFYAPLARIAASPVKFPDYVELGRPAGNWPQSRAQAPLQLLKDAEGKIARIDAEIILAHLLGVSRAELYIYDDDISDEIIAKFNNLVHERSTGKPLQYILGKAEFMGLEFIVTPDVSIPRPETELLVEETIRLYTLHFTLYTDNARPHILDLGTGSGNIAIALTKFIPDCRIIISDVSARALSLAKENARLNLVDKKIDFILSDLFEKLPKMKFDIIVSNPPYVALPQFAELSKEISFEPRIALDGGPDGLDFYRRVIRATPRFLKANGFLILEIGFGQAAEIAALLGINQFRKIRFIEDYNNIKRVTVSQWIN